MVDHRRDAFDQILADNDRIVAALQRAGREAELTHARLGRSIPAFRDEKIVWLKPVEIFAKYGLDEFGRPLGS